MDRPEWAVRIPEWRDYYDSKLHPEVRALVNGVEVTVKTHRRLVSRAGYCGVYKSTRNCIIKLSHHLDEGEAKETFGHEYAHLVVTLLYWGRQIEGAHGVEWRTIMRILGLEPEVFHSLQLWNRWVAEVAGRGRR